MMRMRLLKTIMVNEMATKRPDTGTMKNGIMVFAASLIDAKIKGDTMIVEMLEKKGDKATASRIKKNIERMKTALDVIDKNSGCWS